MRGFTFFSYYMLEICGIFCTDRAIQSEQSHFKWPRVTCDWWLSYCTVQVWITKYTFWTSVDACDEFDCTYFMHYSSRWIFFYYLIFDHICLVFGFLVVYALGCNVNRQCLHERWRNSLSKGCDFPEVCLKMLLAWGCNTEIKRFEN